MSTPHPRLSVEGHVARILLDRPERHNSLGAADLAEFRAHLATVEADPSIRVLVLTGSGDDTFCSGAALDQIASGEMSGRIFETLTSDLAVSRVPTVCALNGSVYGGGTEIALCCDFRIGVHGTRMAVPAARLGICYPASGLARFVDAIGPAATRRVMLAGEELDAQEMLATGFVDRLVAREELSSTTDALAERLASLAPLAIQAMKRILRGIAAGSLDTEEVEALVRRCEASEDLKEGLLARREGRAPEFRGR